MLNAQAVDIGEVQSSRLNVRARPDAQSAIVTILRKGTQVTILGHESGWYHVDVYNKIGYIRARDRYLRIISGGKRDERAVDIESLPDDTADVTQFKLKAQEIQREIETSKTELLTFTKKESEVLDNLNDLDLSLNNVRKQVKYLRTELGALTENIKITEARLKTLSEKIAKVEGYATQRLIAFYKLSWLGKTQVLTPTESIFDIFHRQNNLERIIIHDQNHIRDLLENKRRIQKLRERQAAQISKQHGLEAEMNEEVKGLSLKRDQRSNLLAGIREKKSLEMAAIDALSKAATALDEKIRSLSEMTEEVVYVTPSNHADRKPFSLSKGLLNMPVRGTVVSEFGPYNNTEFNVVNFRSGIDIMADRGEPIRSVAAGKVLYASWFKGYGNMMIIDHGEHYYTIYAHIEELFKSQNDLVDIDEVIATVGDTGSRTGPKLYFEVRHHGKSIDPLPWMKKEQEISLKSTP